MSQGEELANLVESAAGLGLGITSSPSTTLEITIDITEASKTERVLGQMVHVLLEEDGANVLVVGQIISVETKNRWHEDQSFKGVIKRHGGLPHLSGTADNRVAKISVQSCYRIEDTPVEHILGNSPPTGKRIQKMENEVMSKLVERYGDAVTYIGKVYGTNVNLPFWFKHFGRTASGEEGAKDAYHIGVFGKTGSGKTVTASMMLLGYAKNKSNMSILVLDPQGQFSIDTELLPSNVKLSEHLRSNDVNCEKLRILSDIYLPNDSYDLFGELIANNGFIEEAFAPFYDKDKIRVTKNVIIRYLTGRGNSPRFGLSVNESGGLNLLKEMLNRFITPDDRREYSKYVMDVYGTRETRQRLHDRIESLLDNLEAEQSVVRKWQSALQLFSEDDRKKSISQIVEKIVLEKGNFVVLDLRPEDETLISENLPAVFIKIIEEEIVKLGSKLYSQGEKANCLIVMDEAHRFIAKNSTDIRVRELTSEITNSVRTTRKYGIGYMFITQTIESLDDEILRQMRIYGFGYGLTFGAELRKVNEIVNNKPALELYKSFIDPSSSGRFPFMFFGPISPLSFTGAPLFLEVYTDFKDYR